MCLDLEYGQKNGRCRPSANVQGLGAIAFLKNAFGHD